MSDRKRKEHEESSDQGAAKKTAMDVEELIKKRQEEEAAKNKPVFLSKAERERLALERRAKEAEEKKTKLEEERKLREKFVEPSKSDARNDRRDGRDSRDSRDHRDSRDSRDSRNDRDRRRDDRDQRDSRDTRDREQREREQAREARQKEREVKKESAEEKKEQELIRKQYLGGKAEKKKVVRPSEKFKFVFDWDAGEDTSNSMYKTRHEVKPQFGRGYLAGIDKESQIDRTKLGEMKRAMYDNRDKAVGAALAWADKALEDMTDRDWRIFREEFNITSKGGSIPKPIRFWREAQINKMVLEAVDKVGYKSPTPIQRQAIPIGLQGRDVMGIAETGSGKTAAFVIPMLDIILSMPKLTEETQTDGPYAIIMAPTRELATQIEQEVVKFAAFCGIRSVSVIGGLPIEEQAFQLRAGCEVIIATPGRLLDCIQSRYLVLNQCMYVVLDEADRMIDLGFEPQVNGILDAMPSTHLKSEDETEASRQENQRGKYRITTMYSATMPPGVDRLARKYLRRPAHVIIGEVGKAVDRITQTIEWSSEEGKMRHLMTALQSGPPPPIIVFVNKKKACDTIAKNIEKQMGYRSTSLHSGKNQLQREASIEGFKAKRFDVLVATDVAGRGLDVKGVTHVINFDMPKTMDDYTHRIGRTGRAGSSGLATSFVTNDDEGIMYDLKQMLTNTGNAARIPPEVLNHAAAQYKPGAIPDKQSRSKTVIFAKH